jgi:hypothetical protein
MKRTIDDMMNKATDAAAAKKQPRTSPAPSSGLHQLTSTSWMEVFENVLQDFDAYLTELRKDMWPEARPSYLMFGRPAVSRRTQRFFATNPKIKYNFTGSPGKTHSLEEGAGLVQKCLDFAKQKYPEFDFNGALVNLYKDFTCLLYTSDAADDM